MRRFYHIFLVLFVLIVFLLVAPLATSFRALYSPDLKLRWQTEALLAGHLNIATSPVGYDVEWEWGENGIQQQWNLGVPLLRLPFEFVAQKVFGWPGFPDRLLFLLMLCFSVWLLISSFSLHTLFKNESKLIFVPACIAFLSPAFLRLIAIRFEIYEEVISYLVLSQFIVVSFLLRFAFKPSIKRLYLVSLLAAFLPIIRPTGIFPALATLCCAFLVFKLHAGKWRHVAIATVIFACGPLFVLCTNYLRYAAFFEFGHALSISLHPTIDFFMRFEYPYQDEPLSSAIKELFGAMFLSPQFNDWNYFEPGLANFQSATPRFREFYFATYNTQIVLFLIALLSPLMLKARSLSYNVREFIACHAETSLLILWATLSFSLLFCFYLYSPAISSRYFLDFLPSITTLLISLWIISSQVVSQDSGNKWSKSWPFASALVILASYVMDFHSSKETLNRTHYMLPGLSADELQSQLNAASNYLLKANATSEKLPDYYQCGQDFDSYGIKANGQDWSDLPTCTATTATVVFFQHSSCYKLTVAPLAGEAGFQFTKAQWSNLVRVRENANFLRLKAVENKALTSFLTFCAENDSLNYNSSAISMLTIGWTSKEALREQGPHPKAWTKLLKIERQETVANF